MRTFWFCVVFGSLGLLWLLSAQPMNAGPADVSPPEAKATATPDGAPAPISAEAVAQRVWTLTNLVLKEHLDPPTRQEMVLAGAKALLRRAGTTAPHDLSQRISTLATEEQFKALVRELWTEATGNPNETTLALQAALLEGLLSPVPGRANLLSAEEVKTMEVIAGNRYVGTGIQIRFHEDRKLVQIVTPLPRGPARRAGAKAGDLILRVDDKNTEGMSVQQVVALVRGGEGTPVTFVVRQPDSDETRTLKMIRGVIPFETILGHKRLSEESWQYRVDAEAPIAYVTVQSITSSTLHELRQIERQLQSEGFRALVLDLRFCIGGHLHHAALLADGLLDGGLMWRVRDVHDEVKEYRADRDCLFRDWPLAVLVMRPLAEESGPIDFSKNAAGRKGEVVTASNSAELVVMALQDNGRAVVVGDRTLSDGYCRSLVPLPDGQGMLRLRTGRLERGKPTQDGWGVQPHYTVALNQDQQKSLFIWQNANARPERPADAPERAPEDPQLAKAVELLRAALKSQETAK